MPIAVRCAECGRAYSLDDHLAGSDLRCLDCAAVIPVPGEPPEPEVCVICHADLRGQMRATDEGGFYYCDACWRRTQSALAAMPAEARALRGEILRQRRRDARPRRLPSRPRTSELARLVHVVFNTRRGWRFWLLVATAWAGLSIATFFLPKVALAMWATTLVVGAFILIFALVWTIGPPFGEGWSTGMGCLTSRRKRRQWLDRNRDYQIRWPGWTAFLGLLCLATSWGYFYLAMNPPTAERPELRLTELKPVSAR